MPRRSTVWRVVAGGFTLINFGGFIFAGVMGEPMHAAVHAVLTVLGGVFFGVLQIRSAPERVTPTLPQETAERLKHLEQSLDALAIGVERVGEAQRYQTKILDEKNKARPPKNEG
jgi:hypothetical protein